MATHPVFDLLLEGVDDGLERKVLRVLMQDAGRRVSRPMLVMQVFKVFVRPSELASCGKDRQIREAIERLQGLGYPILASSGQAGYMLGGEEQQLDDYLVELVSRKVRIEEKIGHLRVARKWMPFIREWIADRAVVQARLF